MLKKIFLAFVFLFIVNGITAQSEKMQTLIKVMKDNCAKDGVRIYSEGFVDINSYRPISSQTINFDEDLTYGFIVIIEPNVYTQITLFYNNQSAELPAKQKTAFGLTLTMTSVGDISGPGEVIASINNQLWHDGYMIITVH